MFPFFFSNTFAFLSFFFFFFSLSFYGAAPGAMANHLISNALLRPHGTNNPYNTLLGEPAVCNNPSVSMYNAQGVLEFILTFSSESPILCSFYGHILFFFPSSCLFFLLEADTQTLFTFHPSWCFYFPFSLGWKERNVPDWRQWSLMQNLEWLIQKG